MLLTLWLSSRAAFINFEDQFLVLGFTLAVAIWFYSQLKIPTAFFVYLGMFALWVLLIAFVEQRVSYPTLIGHLLRVAVGIIAVVVLNNRLFHLFPLWVYRLSLMGLPLYALGLFAPDLIAKAYALTPEILTFHGGTLIEGRLDSGLPRASWLFYTLSPTRLSQNAGFMWEPAAFAFVTVSALTLRLIRGHRSLDKQNIILTIATLTTLSTTGYLGLALALGYWVFSVWENKLLAVACLLPAIVTALLGFDFILPKITAEFETGYSDSMRWSLSRYASFLRDFEVFRRSPLLGTGLVADPGYDSHNGFSDYLRRYGLFWTMATLVLLATSLRRVATLPGTATFLAVILVFAWSEKFFELPLFYALQFAVFLPLAQRVYPQGGHIARSP